MKTFVIKRVQHPHPLVEIYPLSLAGDERQKYSCRQGEQHSFVNGKRWIHWQLVWPQQQKEHQINGSNLHIPVHITELGSQKQKRSDHSVRWSPVVSQVQGMLPGALLCKFSSVFSQAAAMSTSVSCHVCSLQQCVCELNNILFLQTTPLEYTYFNIRKRSWILLMFQAKRHLRCGGLYFNIYVSCYFCLLLTPCCSYSPLLSSLPFLMNPL